MKPSLFSYYRRLRQPVWTTELGFRHRWGQVDTARYAFWAWEYERAPFYADPLSGKLAFCSEPLTLGDWVIVATVAAWLTVIVWLVYSHTVVVKLRHLR